MMQEQEKRNKRIGWLASATVQLLLLLLFYFLVAWREPFPPIPTYGIELNFGLDNSGRGEQPVESTEPAPAEEEPIEEIETAEPEVVETEENITEDPVEEVVPEEVPTDNIEEVQDFEDTNSPVPVEPEETEVVEPKPVAKPDPVQETKPVEDKPQQKINEQALMPSTDSKQNNESQGNTQPGGDEGKEEGTIDGRAIYGSQGSADGASLNMAGWTWDFKPEPKDNSSESGKIVYKIVIDDEGYMSRIDLVSSTVSPDVERLYRQSVERLSFSKTNDYQPAPTSTGYVTFIIKTR